MSPDRNRALAFVIAILCLAIGGGFTAYRMLRAPATPTSAPAAVPAKPVKPAPPAWRPAPIVVGPTSARPPRAAFVPPDASPLWPVKGPAPLPGSLLPEHLIVAYYGHPKATRMGILGQLPPEEMLPKLVSTATEWAQADPGRKVLPALHVIVTVAQKKPGRDGMYRLRHSDEIIEEVLGWAKERRWVVFLDVQIGQSTVASELPRLLKHLERPDVHLALDPEFAMGDDIVPGRRVGKLDAADVNHAVQALADIVDRLSLPPKVLVVHRFTRGMLTNYAKIKLDPRVQIVIDMDGFGSQALKENAYRNFVAAEPVQFTGFKLFYKNDKPMMTPDDVLNLWPAPVYIQYQ